jgi:hypothetical protein
MRTEWTECAATRRVAQLEEMKFQGRLRLEAQGKSVESPRIAQIR